MGELLAWTVGWALVRISYSGRIEMLRCIHLPTNESALLIGYIMQLISVVNLLS
jgi:hypothetical protein